MVVVRRFGLMGVAVVRSPDPVLVFRGRGRVLVSVVRSFEPVRASVLEVDMERRHCGKGRQPHHADEAEDSAHHANATAHRSIVNCSRPPVNWTAGHLWARGDARRQPSRLHPMTQDDDSAAQNDSSLAFGNSSWPASTL